VDGWIHKYLEMSRRDGTYRIRRPEMSVVGDVHTQERRKARVLKRERSHDRERERERDRNVIKEE